MKKVVDLMITDLVTIKETDSLATAKELMAEKNIRNLPVVDNDGQCLGMLTQREYLKHAFYLVSQFGTQLLSKKEAQTPVKNAMNTDILTLTPDTDLDIAAQFFISNKYGSLPVVDNDKLVGILTPVDFVKLAHTYLKDA
ncbi:CBS domain-containing protein [Marinomonas mediterranea]|uniref:CBS domain containing membrane protein n=1 Tax=Marinomonas mediterranea (strain ATCC 700492 / JCM 21426 / NBRC 103028 / MMB-1) TaxID=717774 RepID=F2JV50_MARM1|nr:CBS domain-containing protein [Marinomonas mediterranea]ADZ92808.1 CBS domain containing membrane protein [Marinomonas mediterranea MMB-1]WCN10741.1 CBS domain-containing protein [Marinomonas mediterranea]WCN14798.1 CBS domain-containing protein [Marinomonas mediterranea]WCN18831.1 CBS domain-containing protein [Marinomonas mediterranea MMB-1]